MFSKLLRNFGFMGLVLPLVATAVILVACGGNEGPQIVEDTLTTEYADADTLFPRLRFADGQISLNDRCPVRKVKLNHRMPPVYVNGKPVGFC